MPASLHLTEASGDEGQGPQWTPGPADLLWGMEAVSALCRVTWKSPRTNIVSSLSLHPQVCPSLGVVGHSGDSLTGLKPTCHLFASKYAMQGTYVR